MTTPTLRFCFLLNVLIGLFACQTATAQTASFQVREVKGATANYFERRLPRNHKTRKLVAFQPNGAKSVLVLHCFEGKFKDEESGENTKTFVVIYKQNSRSKRLKWQRLARFALLPDESSGRYYSYDQISADGFYIDQKNQKIPSVRMSFGSWFGGSAGGTTIRLFNFADASFTRIAVDDFESSSSLSYVIGVSFDKVDKKGLVAITVSGVPGAALREGTPEQISGVTKSTDYFWNGSKFEVQKNTSDAAKPNP